MNIKMILCLSILYMVHIPKAKTESIECFEEDYKIIKAVFDDLIEAKGVKNMPIPKLIVSNSKRNVAWSNYKKTEIGIEVKAFDICMSFGKDSLNALAAILSHELIHYYEKHGWVELFVAENENHEISNTQPNMIDNLKMETQADYLGGFLAYAAGYNTLEIMPKFLSEVYKQYGLNEKMKGYPSLKNRKTTAQNSLEKSKKLVDTYEFANYLAALGEYENATVYYDYILKEYQSREIYNNIGVLLLSEFASISSKTDMKFVYPFEMDFETRLNTIKRGGISDFAMLKERKAKILKQAIANFETAIALDKDYAISYLNLACANVLSEEYDDATYFANKAKKLAGKENRKLISDVYVLLGIIEANSKPNQSKNENFETAYKMDNGLAKVNLEIIKGIEKFLPNKTSTSSGKNNNELIGSFSLDKCIIDLRRERFTPSYTLKIGKNFIFAALQQETFIVYIHIDQTKDEYIILQTTKKDYKTATAYDIFLKGEKESILSAYGNEYSNVQYNRGEILHFPKKQIAFQMNENQKLEKWMLYRKKKL